MDGLAKLVEDHEHLRTLASRLEQAEAAGDSELSRELTRQITAELNTVAAVEQEVVYPAVRELSPELASQVDEALHEQVIAKELLFEAATSASIAGVDTPPDVSLVTEAVEHMTNDAQLLSAVRDAADEHELATLSRAAEQRVATLDSAAAAGRDIKEQDESAGEADQGPASGAETGVDPISFIRKQ
jgi:hypothetical protein